MNKFARIDGDRVWVNTQRWVSIETAERAYEMHRSGYSNREISRTLSIDHRWMPSIVGLGPYQIDPDLDIFFEEPLREAVDYYRQQVIEQRSRPNNYLEQYLSAEEDKYNNYYPEVREYIEETISPLAYILITYDSQTMTYIPPTINPDDTMNHALFLYEEEKNKTMVLSYTMLNGNGDFDAHWNSHHNQVALAYRLLHATHFMEDLDRKAEIDIEETTLEIITKLIAFGMPPEDVYGSFEDHYSDSEYYRYTNLRIEIRAPKGTQYAGFFPYTFVDEEYKKYNFVGIEDDNVNYNCFFDSLNVSLELSEEVIAAIRARYQGLQITRRDLKPILTDISKMTKHTLVYKIFSIDGKFTKAANIPSRTIRITYSKDAPVKRMTIALMNNHFFNCNVRGSVTFLAKCASNPSKYLRRREVPGYNPGDDSKLSEADLMSCIGFDNRSKRAKESKRTTYVFFDIESTVAEEDESGQLRGCEHKPFMVCYKTYCAEDEEQRSGTLYGQLCVLNFLKRMSRILGRVILYAHNAGKYDMEFFKQYLSMRSEIYNGGIIQMSGAFEKKPLEFRDTYRMIPTKLALFPSMFGLEDEKEVYPYTFPLLGTMYDGVVPAAKYWNSEADRAEYIERFGETFNDFKYTQHYCMRDVEVMMDGFMKFRAELSTSFRVDAFDYLTLPSIANDLMERAKSYDRVPMVAGKIATFIRKSVTGGRVLLGAEPLYRHDSYEEIVDAIEAGLSEEEFLEKFGDCLDDCIVDFDAVSLYPSAMSMMELPAGEPFIIEDFEEVLEKDLMFFGEFQIEIKKPRQFPLLSYRFDVTRNFTNNLITPVVLDYYAFKDAVEFHNAEYRFIQGIAFPERTTAHQTMIKRLFDMRLQKKREKNPLQVVYKLLMNSAYGKTILNYENLTSVVYKTESELRDYVDSHVETFKKSTPFKDIHDDTKHRCEVRNSGLNFERVIVGATVLSYSKHLMNAVMCLDDEIEKTIYYQDTDSIHIKAKYLSTLEAKFREKYGKELIGPALGQFHSDFDPGKRYRGVRGFDVCSIRSVFIGKKTYYDELLCVDRETGKIVLKSHQRAKGVVAEALCAADYLAMLRGHSITVDLCDFKPIFKRDRVGKIESLNTFERTIRKTN